MKHYLKLCGVTFLVLVLFVSCGKESPSPADTILSLIAVEKLPAGRLYDSKAAAHEEYYMPKDLGRWLYAIRGYDELSHVEEYAVYLGSRFDSSLELAVFLAKDLAAVSEVTDMCRIRAEYLIGVGQIAESEACISTRGRAVFFIVGMEREKALELLKSIK
jgi:hypothetical protein